MILSAKIKTKIDYECKNNGTKIKNKSSRSIHGDGNRSHWNHVLKLCSKSMKS